MAGTNVVDSPIGHQEDTMNRLQLRHILCPMDLSSQDVLVVVKLARQISNLQPHGADVRSLR
jgi:hypothetical protein